MAAQYKLAATLSGHTADVRAVASTSSGSVLSSSRDSTARRWSKSSSQSAWQTEAVYAGHEGFVGAVTTASLDGQEVVVTGSNDSTIQVWPLHDAQEARPQPIRMLVGHAGNACCLAARDNIVVSGSWDCTAKVWDLNAPGESKYTLQGSDLSIWAVLLLPTIDGTILTLTASADKLIRLYRNETHINTFKGHSQPVRGLALLPNEPSLFASCGNDGSIIIWDWQTGSSVRTLAGHESFAYSLASSADGTLFSSGEDRSVRVWSKGSGDLQQIITIPAISIWSVAVLAGTSDIIVGSSDSEVRIFTQDPARYAPADVLEAYEATVSASAINTTQVGDVKKSDLPGEEVLSTRAGKKEGEILMIKNSKGDVEAYQWSSGERRWIKIGQVVDAVGQGRKQLYEGKEYDYVFDVDVSEGQPPLKLPFNVTQNPYEAAQAFLNKNELPQSYIDQVVQFIEKNTEGTTLGGQGGLDPYTGASSYRGGGSSAATGASNGSFTADPWGSSSASAAQPAILPHRTFLTFGQANLSAIQKKILDLNGKLAENIATATEFPMDSADTITLQELVTSLSSNPASFSLTQAGSTLLEKLLDWPGDVRYPVLDLVRVVSLHAPLPQLAFTLVGNLTPAASASAKEIETNSMLALRALANMFPKGKKSLGDSAPEILETLSLLGLQGLNKNGKTALATVALNFSILAVEGSLQPEAVSLLLDLLEHVLADTEPETIYRASMAFGNIVYSPDSVKGGLQVGKIQSVKAQVQKHGRAGEPRLKAVVSDIEKKA